MILFIKAILLRFLHSVFYFVTRPLCFRYNMVFAPFTGVDKHNKCVTFASTLLSREDVTNFTWAFNAMLKAMRRNPVVLVTDQCPAMKQAVPECFKATDEFPASRHRLCMWHITEKFPAKVYIVLVICNIHCDFCV